MASPPVIDFARLLAPIPGASPAGTDLRADSSPTSVYYKIKGARSAAREAEKALINLGQEPSGAYGEWRPVLEHATKAIAEQAKDLEIIAYLIESLVRQHGFAGFRDGYRLAREMVEKYWDGLYPLPDEDGLATRVAHLTGLNGEEADGTLINPISNVRITQGTSVGPFSAQHFNQANALKALADPKVRDKRIAEGAVSLEVFAKAVAESSGDFYKNLMEDLTQCEEEFAKITTLLDEKCGQHAPPASNIRSALVACKDIVANVAREKLPAAQPAAAPGAGKAGAAAPQQAAAAGPGVGVLATREDAFEILKKVAEFFRRTEPHTPISYALEQIVRWGRMSLPELLAELIPDENPRKQFFRQVGIKPPEPEKK